MRNREKRPTPTGAPTAPQSFLCHHGVGIIVAAAMLSVLGCGSDESTAETDEGFYYPAPDLGAPLDTASDEPPDVVAPADTGQPVLDNGPEPVDEGPAEPPDPGPAPEPEDVPQMTPEVTPTDAGQTDPGGTLKGDTSQKCEALGLAEKWDGTFDGEITSNFGDVDVEGTMNFEIGCLAGKLIVTGEMTGFGQGQPFTVKLQGSYSPSTQEIKAKLVEGSVALFFLLPVAFEGDFSGVYDGAEFKGDWSGENTDKTLLDAKGVGTWVAQAQ